MSLPISIVIPVLDERAALEVSLQSLQPLRARGHEVIVVDGGSRDNSLALARRLADRAVMSGAGRALQLNAGAEFARHEVLLFLRPGAQLPENADELVAQALAPETARWGRFDIRFATQQPLYQLLALGINWYSHLRGIASGSQAIFVQREHFERVGSHDRIPVLEDITLSRKLRHFARPARIKQPLRVPLPGATAGGVLRALVQQWWLRAAFSCGADPFRLAEGQEAAAGKNRE